MTEKLEEIKQKIYESDLTNTREMVEGLSEEEKIELVNMITVDRDYYRHKITDLENV